MKMFFHFIIFANLIFALKLLNNSITLKFKTTGKQQIIYSNFAKKPNYVFINDKEVPFLFNCVNISNYTIYNINYTVQINSINDRVKLVWNYSLNNCSYMFKGLTNITSIDFSDFDFSLVINMLEMFCNCVNIEHINFNNIKITNVESMSNMFYCCEKIT